MDKERLSDLIFNNDILAIEELLRQPPSSPEQVRELADEIERYLIEEPIYSRDTVEFFKVQFLASARMKSPEIPGEREQAQAYSGLFLWVFNAKGEEAHPYVKAVISKIAKLSDEDYNNSSRHHLAVLYALEETVYAEDKQPLLRENPFRGKGPTP